jgi:hypothetical protein
MSKIKQHLEDSETRWLEHTKFALYASIMLLYASIASLIHAIIPAFFPSTAARIVAKLYKQRLENHPNPEYKKYLNE